MESVLTLPGFGTRSSWEGEPDHERWLQRAGRSILGGIVGGLAARGFWTCGKRSDWRLGADP